MSTSTTIVRPSVDLGEDPLATIVGILRDLSDELENLTDRLSILESENRGPR